MPTINVISITTIKVPGATQMTANDINEHGQVVGQYTDEKGAVHGFIYEEESFCQLDYPEAASTNILGINNLGQMVGMFTTLTATAGFLYDRDTFSPPLSYPGAGNLTIANALNDRGHIVGVYQGGSPGNHAFLCKAGRFQPLVYPGSAETTAEAVNNNGQIVGNFPDAKGTHGYVYLENVGVFTPALSFPKATVLALRAINHGGQIAGGFTDAQGHEHPFVYMDGRMNPVRIPNAISVSINGINDHGQVTGNGVFERGPASFIAALPF